MHMIARIALLLGVTLVLSSGASAQISQSYVSVLGDNSNPCTRVAPCSSFATAISKTATTGAVTALDSGEFGSFSLSRSMTVGGAPGVFASVTTSGLGVYISGDPFAKVILKNLEFDLGVELGQTAIQFEQGASVVVEDVRIRNAEGGDPAIRLLAPNATMLLRNVAILNSVGNDFGGAIRVTGGGGTQRVVVENALLNGNSRAIQIEGSGNLQLSLSDTAITNSTREGIIVSPSGGTTRLVIRDSKVVNNVGTGVLIAPTGNAKVHTTIIGSGLDGNLIGIRSFPASPAVSNVTISDTSASNNAGGIHASGKSVVSIIRSAVGGNSSYGVGALSPAAVRIGSSVVSGNTLGFSGPISSYGNNQLHGNTSPGSSTPLPPGSAP